MTTRRNFLKTSLAAGAALTMPLSLARSAHAGGTDGFRVGLIGCGGRGSGAAANAMNAGDDVKLVAMADLFEDRLVPARARLKELSPNQVQVDDDHLFLGFDAYQKVIESDVDVVLLAAASHFTPSTSRRPSRRASMCSARSRTRSTCPASSRSPRPAKKPGRRDSPSCPVFAGATTPPCARR